jgi:hypothetical protein
MRVIASSTACSTARRYATSQDRLLRREYGVRLRRSGRSEQDDPSINDHARGDWRGGLLLADFRGVFSKTTLSFSF